VASFIKEVYHPDVIAIFWTGQKWAMEKDGLRG
jgi:hypothetical protein